MDLKKNLVLKARHLELEHSKAFNKDYPAGVALDETFTLQKGIEVCAQGLSHYVVAIETVRTRWLTLGCGG